MCFASEYITIEYQVPLTKLNPFFGKFKLLYMEFLNENIKFNKSNLLYTFCNEIYGKKIDFNNTEQKKYIRKFAKIIENSCDDKYSLSIKYEDAIIDEQTPLNEEEIKKLNFYREKYKNEFQRIQDLKNKFLNNYIDATKLKNAHLSLNCGGKRQIKSKCDLIDFWNVVGKNTNSQMCEYIKNKYKRYYLRFAKKNIDINNSNISQCFTINQTIDLFIYYITAIIYCRILLEKKPHFIRKFNTFFFDFEKDKYFFQKGVKLYIKHLDTIYNTTIEANNEIIKCNYMFFFKTYGENRVVNRTDVCFE